MKATFYRLGEYKIIEDDNGALWWEAHAGLGALVGGKCFIRGEILFIGPRESEEPGFLANEFLNQIERFPKWGKTKHCCLNYTICECRSGRKLTEEEIAAWSISQTQLTEETGFSGTPFGKGNQEQGSDSKEDVSYRLGRYEIIQKPSGQMWWKTPSGHTGLRVGKSILAGDILFMEVGETEEQGNLKHAFLERLNQLPEWRTTKYYCASCALYDCKTGKNQAREEGGGRPSEAPSASPRGIFTPPARKASSYPHSTKLWRIPYLDSSLSFLKEISAKARKSVERKPHGAGLKNKSRRKTKIIKSDLTAPKAPIHVYRIKRWIAYIGAFMLIIGALLLALLHGHWKNWDGHHNHLGHSSSHHRDH